MNTLPVLGLTQTWWGVDQVVRRWSVANCCGLLLAGQQHDGGDAVVLAEHGDQRRQVRRRGPAERRRCRGRGSTRTPGMFSGRVAVNSGLGSWSSHRWRDPLCPAVTATVTPDAAACRSARASRARCAPVSPARGGAARGPAGRTGLWSWPASRAAWLAGCPVGRSRRTLAAPCGGSPARPRPLGSWSRAGPAGRGAAAGQARSAPGRTALPEARGRAPVMASWLARAGRLAGRRLAAVVTDDGSVCL